MNHYTPEHYKNPLSSRLTGIALSLGVLASLAACSSSSERVSAHKYLENATCVEATDVSVEQLRDLSGQEMRQDLNDDPYFRAATINIAFKNTRDGGYGSGGLYRLTDGSLVVRTVRHVLEPLTASEIGGVYFPGIGWLEASGCNIEAASSDIVGDSGHFGDAVSEIRLSGDTQAQLEAEIIAGTIAPLLDLSSDGSAPDPSELVDRGFTAMIARADTGEYTQLAINDEVLHPRGDVMKLMPFIDESGGELDSNTICGGRSGGPVQLGKVGMSWLSRESLGVVMSISHKPEQAGTSCSPYANVLTYQN